MRTSKEDERAHDLIRQEIEEGLDSLTDQDIEFRQSYWQRPLTGPELEVLRSRLGAAYEEA